MRQSNEQLIEASSRGDVYVVKLLLENELADVHAHSDRSLRLASMNGHLEVVKLLIANGADVHVNEDETLRWASKNGHTEVVKYLQQVIRKEKISWI
jgi:ankyrin repeat protein